MSTGQIALQICQYHDILEKLQGTVFVPVSSAKFQEDWMDPLLDLLLLH